MKPVIVKVPVEEIHDWDSFHTVFTELMGFPDFYGRNMNAWIDCMGDLDSMTKFRDAEESGLILDLGDCSEFAKRCAELFQAVTDGVGFVNYRKIESGNKPVLLLSFYTH